MKERPHKRYSPVEGAAASFLADYKAESRERRALNSLIALTALAAAVAPSVDTPMERRRLGLKLNRLWDTITPMNGEEQQLAAQLRSVVTGEAQLPLTTARLKMRMEAIHGDVEQGEVQRAQEEYERRTHDLDELADAHDPQPLFAAVVDSFGRYDETHSYITDLLNGVGGNCEARAYYACGLVEDVMPEFSSRLSLQTVWVENADGTITPHIRCVYQNEDGTLTPLEGDVKPESPTTTTAPTETAQMQLAQAFLRRHDSLPKDVRTPVSKKSIPKKPNGDPWEINDNVTDSILLHPFAPIVLPYQPGVQDDKPIHSTVGKPSEVIIHHFPQDEWDVIARDPNHPKRKGLFEPEQQEEMTRQVLRTAEDVRRYIETHTMNFFTPEHIELTTAESREAFITGVFVSTDSLIRDTDMVLIPSWADKMYSDIFEEHMRWAHGAVQGPITVRIAAQNPQDILPWYWKQRRSNEDEDSSVMESDHYIVTNIGNVDPSLLAMQQFGSFTIDVLSDETLNRLVETDFLQRYLDIVSSPPLEWNAEKPLAIQVHRLNDIEGIEHKLRELEQRGYDVKNKLKLQKIIAQITTKEELLFLLDEKVLGTDERESRINFLLDGVNPLSDLATQEFVNLFEQDIADSPIIGVNCHSSPEAVAHIARVFFKRPPSSGRGKELRLEFTLGKPNAEYLRAISQAGVDESIRQYIEAHPENVDDIRSTLHLWKGQLPADEIARMIYDERFNQLHLVLTLYEFDQQQVDDVFNQLAEQFEQRDAIDDQFGGGGRYGVIDIQVHPERPIQLIDREIVLDSSRSFSLMFTNYGDVHGDPFRQPITPLATVAATLQRTEGLQAISLTFEVRLRESGK